jgi:osmotically-inducible protein OsmY
MLLRSLPFFLFLFLAACNRQDTDALSRIGSKLSALGQEQTDTLREKYQVSWSLVPGIREKIQQRLAWDKNLEGAKIEVLVSGKSIELKGHVVSEEQRRYALALAENTSGVEKVLDTLQISAP